VREMTMLKKLVPKSVRDYLYSCHDGYGFMVFKDSEDELSFIEIVKGKDGKFYTLEGLNLIVYLIDLQRR